MLGEIMEDSVSCTKFACESSAMMSQALSVDAMFFASTRQNPCLGIYIYLVRCVDDLWLAQNHDWQVSSIPCKKELCSRSSSLGLGYAFHYI